MWRIVRCESIRWIRARPSPFASALLFSYVANYIYDGDAPLAERRAQALSIDQDQLRELMGDADLRELLDLAAIEETEEQLQALAETYRARTMDGVHDLLLKLGDLRRDELLARSVSPEVAMTLERLRKSLRVLEVAVAGEKRLIAVEDAGRYRDAVGVPLPPGLPTAFQAVVPDALLDLIRRYGRTHGPVHDGGGCEALWDSAGRGGGGTEPACGTWTRGSKAAFGPAAHIASGVTTRCCGRFGESPWRGCARRLSRSSRPRWRGSLRVGREWCSRGAGWMRCWM